MSLETISPTTSISPPVNIAHPYTNSLPPIQTLPTWTRSKFNKFLRHVPANEQGKKGAYDSINHRSIDRTEICTQTSRSSSKTSTTSIGTKRNEQNTASAFEKQKRNLEKKIVFLEANHSQVLGKLHRELDRVKNENRALQYQLVMSGEKVNPAEDNEGSDHHRCPDLSGNTQQETDSLREEVKELKQLLYRAYAENNEIKKSDEIAKSKSQNQIKQNTKTVDLHPITDPRTHKSLDPSESAPENGKLSKKGAEKGVKCDLVNVSLALQKVWNTMQQKQNTDKHPNPAPANQRTLFLPKLEHKTNRVVALAQNSPYCKKMPERISLPLLPAAPENRVNINLRQKRAKAMHLQRQRSACKDVTMCVAYDDNDGNP